MKPIVFVHFGDRDYLPLTLEIARKFNPGTPIYLLGDDENKKYTSLGWNKKYASLGVIHKPYIDYKSRALGEFTNIFQYISNIEGNLHKKIHFFCFARWFMLYEFMRQENINGLWYFDSDVFVCRNLAERSHMFSGYEMAVINHMSGSAACINSIGAIKKYLDLTILLFNDTGFVNTQKAGVTKPAYYEFCDMTVWSEYHKRISALGELSQIIDNETFDPRISLDRADQIESEPVWEMEGKRQTKVITIKDKIPYCYHIKLKKLIRMNTLNFGTDLLMSKNIWDQLCV